MNAKDFKTLQAVKGVLVRQMIDTTKCDYTCTNGVLYVTGALHLHLGARSGTEDYQYHSELVTVIKRLERTLRQLPEVRDVIFRLDNLAKSGSRWNHVSA